MDVYVRIHRYDERRRRRSSVVHVYLSLHLVDTSATTTTYFPMATKHLLLLLMMKPRREDRFGACMHTSIGVDESRRGAGIAHDGGSSSFTYII